MKEKEQDAQVASMNNDLNSIFAGQMPDLTKSTPAPLELTAEYWTPEKEGETRRMFFSDFKTSMVTDQKTGEDIELVSAYFVEVVDGVKKVICNASRRLTGVLESCNVAAGTPLEITYLGKKRNKNNAYLSDYWSVKPLIVEPVK